MNKNRSGSIIVRDAVAVPQSAGLAWVIVRSTTPGTGTFVQAQRVKGKPGNYSLSGTAGPIAVMPGMVAADYETFISNAAESTVEEVKMLPAMQVDGVWYVWQMFRFPTETPGAGDVLSDAQ